MNAKKMSNEKEEKEVTYKSVLYQETNPSKSVANPVLHAFENAKCACSYILSTAGLIDRTL